MLRDASTWGETTEKQETGGDSVQEGGFCFRGGGGRGLCNGRAGLCNGRAGLMGSGNLAFKLSDQFKVVLLVFVSFTCYKYCFYVLNI